MMNILSRFIRGRGAYVLNQTPKVFADKRTKRERTRANQKMRAIKEQYGDKE